MDSRICILVVALVALFTGVTSQGVRVEPMTEVCLGCVCEAVSNCNRTLGCTGDVCGLFRITWAYWSDAGKPVLQNDSPTAEGAYSRCTVDPYCAATTVQGYMQRFAQDCNGDGVINCFDYASIHNLGGYGCNGPLNPTYQQRFSECISHVSTLSGR